MESITEMYKISQFTKPTTCSLGWLPFFLSELSNIDERIGWLCQAQAGELLKLKELNVSVEEIDTIRFECSLLIRFYRRIKMLIIKNGEAADYINGAPAEDRLSYEMVAYLKSFTPADMVNLAQSFCAYEGDKTKPFIEVVLRMPEFDGHLCFDDICSFSRSLFMVEGWRQHFIKGNPNDRTIIDIHSFPLKLRNACFDEYIQLSIKEIEEELTSDNDRLYEVSEMECLNELYKKEKCAYDRIVGMEQFRGSRAYDMEWYPAKPHVIKMSGYFVQYLAHYIQQKQSNSSSSATIIVPKEKTEDYIEERREPLHTTPYENDYVAVAQWLEVQKRDGIDWYKLNNNNRTAMCRQLSNIFGWTVDQNSLRKAQKRTN